MTAIFWFRQDLRTTDNSALYYLSRKYQNILPIYIYDENLGDKWKIGGASKWYLHHSLEALCKEVPLVILKGDTELQLFNLLKQFKPEAIYWNRCFDPINDSLDAKLLPIFSTMEVKRFEDSLLFHPDSIKTNTKGVYKVFTAFKNACLAHGIQRHPLPKVKLQAHTHRGLNVEDLNLLPTLWGKEFNWKAGEDNAIKKLEDFTIAKLKNYVVGRDFPYQDATSELSAALHFGEISPLTIWHKVSSINPHFARQLIWREFSYYILYHYPNSLEQNYNKDFDNFPYNKECFGLNEWKQGLTGYPIVDAGMRQLWRTGFMHNRVRMITASFLTKTLLINWREGHKWFWDTLIDADLANNTMAWQWCAGSGVDAAPYFRIFNPTLQSKKFDESGAYIKQWVPELLDISNQYIHQPHLAPNYNAQKYPLPIIDYASQRILALQLYKKMQLVQ